MRRMTSYVLALPTGQGEEGGGRGDQEEEGEGQEAHRRGAG